MRQAVEIGVPDLESRFVGLHQRIGRRGDVLGHPKRVDQGPGKGGLAGADRPFQQQHVAGPDAPRHAPRQRVGGVGVGQRDRRVNLGHGRSLAKPPAGRQRARALRRAPAAAI